MKYVIITILSAIMLLTTMITIQAEDPIKQTDIDPLTDIMLNMNITCIRGLEESIQDDDPILKLIVTIDNETFTSPIWEHLKYINTTDFSITSNVEDEKPFVTIKMELFDLSTGEEILCDLGNNSKDVTITYDLRTGHWTGDDYLGDPSGYGRLCGCDDGSIYQDEMDYELWFTIKQTDYDNDTIPYWTEVNTYQTDPLSSNLGEDEDQDFIPIEWEHFWGYDPYQFNDHELLDDDQDSISNYEEYLTQHWDSDPFRQDIFLEIDWMEEGPNGEIAKYPIRARELLKNPFHRRNIIFHVDLGEENGGELIPFEQRSNQQDIRPLYNEYFIHNGTYQWRRGVFHWAVFVNEITPRGYAFSGDTPPYWGYIPGTNGFVVASRLMEDKNASWKFRDKPLEYFYGSVTMHEMGHNFGIRNGNPGGCDNFFAKYPWQIQFWVWRTYYSIMNYQYTYYHFDYSDGTNGWNDFNDWDTIDLSYFERPSE